MNWNGISARSDIFVNWSRQAYTLGKYLVPEYEMKLKNKRKEFFCFYISTNIFLQNKSLLVDILKAKREQCIININKNM